VLLWFLGETNTFVILSRLINNSVNAQNDSLFDRNFPIDKIEYELILQALIEEI
jgi:hypothetical protein